MIGGHPYLYLTVSPEHGSDCSVQTLMKLSQVYSGFRYQSSKASSKVQRFEDDVGSVVPIRCLQLVADVAVCS